MSSNNDSNDTEGGIVSITNNCISFGGTIIPIRNVSRLRSYELRRKAEQAAVHGAVAVAALVGAGVSAANQVKILAIVLVFLAILFAAAAIRSIMFRRYGLSIETNGGTRDFVVSNNKQFAADVLKVARFTLENLERPASYTVNMDNRKITEGDRFENISGEVRIATRGSTLN